MKKNPSISVILTSYNQSDIINKNIEAWNWIYRNAYKNFELIIVDDGSDENMDYLLKYKFPYPFKFHTHKHEEERSLSKSKNEGIKMAQGEYTLILDGDTFVDENTVKSFLSHLPTKQLATQQRKQLATQQRKQLATQRCKQCLMGKRVKIDYDRFATRAYSPDFLRDCVVGGHYKEQWVDDMPPAPFSTFSGANILMPTTQVKKIGWAPDDWKGFGFDDIYFVLHWLAEGWTVKWVPEAISYHIDHPNTDWKPILKARFVKEAEKLMHIIKQKHDGYFDDGNLMESWYNDPISKKIKVDENS